MNTKFKKFIFIAIVITIIGLLIFLFNFIKDAIVSFQLSQMLKMPVSASGVNFNFNKIFTTDKKLKINHLVLGDDAAKINLQNLQFDTVTRNNSNPNYCFDADARFEKFYLGMFPGGDCEGIFHLTCIPFREYPKGKSTNIHIRNGRVRINDSYLNINADVSSPNKDVTNVNLSGNLEQTELKNILACLNASTDEVKGEIVIPHFNASYTASEEVEPQESLIGSGNFVMYQAKFRVLDLVKPILKKLQIPTSGVEDTKEYDQITGDFNIANENMNLSNVIITSDYVSVVAQGKVDFEQNINFTARAQPRFSNLPSKTLQRINVNNILPQGIIYLTITGTTEKPEIKSDLNATVGNAIKTKALTEVENRLNNAMNKLFN